VRILQISDIHGKNKWTIKQREYLLELAECGQERCRDA